jgi:hypothetical protein
MRVAHFRLGLGGQPICCSRPRFRREAVASLLQTRSRSLQKIAVHADSHHYPAVVDCIGNNDYRKHGGNDRQKGHRNTLADEDQLAKGALFNIGP